MKEEIEEINREIKRCRKCRLCETRKNALHGEDIF
jgi:uracil-DNA glycosylase